MDKCPNCGYTEAPAIQSFKTHMSEYVLKSTGKGDCIFNDNVEELTVRGDVYVRADIYAQKATPAKQADVVPVVTQPTTPPQPKATITPQKLS